MIVVHLLGAYSFGDEATLSAWACLRKHGGLHFLFLRDAAREAEWGFTLASYPDPTSHGWAATIGRWVSATGNPLCTGETTEKIDLSC